MSLNSTHTTEQNSDKQFLIGGGIPVHIQPRDVNETLETGVSRRSFLAKAGIVAAGAILAAPQSRAAFFGLVDDKPVPGIPHAWVQAKGSDVMQYARFIQKLNLRNVTPYMVLAPHFKTRGSVSNTLPPKSAWKNIAPTLKVIDKMTTRIGAPLRDFTSVYRSPRYNRAVGGKSKSYHMQNVACDIQYQGVSAYHVSYIAKQLRDQGYYKGGVGRYSSFVHVDTRGTNVSW
ncbi:MAG: YcbK family protein [Akkermansiaceae bacterium]